MSSYIGNTVKVLLNHEIQELKGSWDLKFLEDYANQVNNIGTKKK